MGYYTRYELEVMNGPNSLIEELIEEYSEASYSLTTYGECYDECKWYDHSKHMIEFSKKHPNVLFKLSGEGENNRDIWHKYYKNGLMQVCMAEITYPPFNSDLLM